MSLMKYPVRVALNPLVSTVGWVLPSIVSGATIVTRPGLTSSR